MDRRVDGKDVLEEIAKASARLFGPGVRVRIDPVNIQNINIHSDIKCELRPDQINPDGSPKNGSFFNEAKGVYDGGQGAVYARLGFTSSGTSDNLVVNGNYFTIDGSDLPYMNVNSDPSGKWKNVGFAKSFVVVDSRIGIFNYEVHPSDGYDNNSFDMNNLTIIGNTVTPSVNYNLSPEEIASAEALMSLNSGGYNGLVVKNGTNHFTNVNILMTVMGIFNTAYGTKSDGTTKNYMVADYVRIDQSWASSMLGYGISGFLLTNCNIGTSGGAAIHIEDDKPNNDDPVVSIDTATTIENWISGQEAWFKVYGMTTTVTAMKSQIETGVSKLGKSVIDTGTNPTTGLETEMINFIMFQLPREGAYVMNEGVYVTGSQVSFMIPDANGTPTNIHRDFDFMNSDLRASEDHRNFAFPVSPLSSYEAFMVELLGPELSTSDCLGADFDLFMSLKGLGLSDATAKALVEQNVGNVVSFEAFYNITRAQAVTAMKNIVSETLAGRSLAPRTAILAVVGSSLPPQPQFLEVQATFDGKVTGGVASIILGLYDPEA